MWEQAEGVSRLSQRSIAPGGSLRLTSAESTQAKVLLQASEIGQNGRVLNVDLTLLRDPKRFQEMCFRLARYEFPDAIPLSETWDGGWDVVVFGSRDSGDVVFQCKFTRDLIRAKRKIVASLDSMMKNGRHTARWILCVPVNPSAIFVVWLRKELENRGLDGHVWARSELIACLLYTSRCV